MLCAGQVLHPWLLGKSEVPGSCEPWKSVTWQPPGNVPLESHRMCGALALRQRLWEEFWSSPGQAAQWVGASSWNRKVAGSVPSLGTYRRQTNDASLSHQ